MDHQSISKYALIVAGGTGTRLGAKIPKQMLPVAGRPILAHTISRFLDYDKDTIIVVVLHPSLLDSWASFCDEQFDTEEIARLHVCAGGHDRTTSVRYGLAKLGEMGVAPEGLVAVHDGVRMFADQDLLARGFAMAQTYGNATAAVSVKSSLRRKDGSGSKSVDRSQFFHVQTPQIFRLGELWKCYQTDVQRQFTDDASLYEYCGGIVHLFPGSYDNIKITTPIDLEIAEQKIREENGLL